MGILAKDQKADIAQTLSWLLSEPDVEMVKALKEREIYRLFDQYFKMAHGEAPAMGGFLPQQEQEDLLRMMREEYYRLFKDPGIRDFWWIESVHKAWTKDPECRLSMAKEKGCVMGDSALHMIDLYRAMGMEVPEEFSGLPDHIVLELEFLAFLFEKSLAEDAVKTFLNDHFDWVPDMVKRGKTYRPSSFYVSVLDSLERFIESERMN